MTKPTQSQVREINRTLLATVRADWRFPDTRPARQNLHHQSREEPVAYRERYYSTSDADEEDDGDESSSWTEELDDDAEELVTTESDETGVEAAVERSAVAPGKPEKHTFYSPDSVAEYLERRVQARKRRKRRALAEELPWNSGLCFFLRRRNMWTGAVEQETLRRRESTKDTFLPTATTPDGAEAEGNVLESKGYITTDAETSTSDEKSSTTHSSPPPDKQETPTRSAFGPPANLSSLTDMLIPIVTPFLPDDHPVRASIMARSPSELYEKVVRDSRTPAVPINLAHMMDVIVQGWKDEGNWPPRGTNAPEAAIASRRNGGAAARTARGLDGAGDASKGIFANHKHIQKGVESVKRALRLSGSAPPPGD